MTLDDLPIWDDVDVTRIYQIHDGQPFPMFHMFNEEPSHVEIVQNWITADQEAGSDGPPDAFVRACLTGIVAVETLTTSAAPGWLKFFTYMTDVNCHFLWNLYRRGTEVAAIADWTVETISRNGWGPDGNVTPLGQRHTYAAALAAASGGGVRRNPVTGMFEVGTGDRARQAAMAGRFPETTSTS
jgi:hypothetical protein